MRILYITTELPYPLTSGYLRHYHFLRALGERHEITYLSLTRKPQVPQETIDALSPLTERMEVYGTKDGGFALVAAVGSIPQVGRKLERTLRLRWGARQMKRAVSERLRNERYDVLFFSGKDTFPAIEDVEGLPIVVDCCDATCLRVSGEMRYASLSRRLWLLGRYLEMRRIEKKMVRKSPYLAFASVRDRRAMVGRDDVGEIIPQAVDLEYWTRRSYDPEPNAIVFTGVMSYRPNHDAALLLVQEILPRVRREVPEATIYIVGRDPQPALVEAARRHPGVTLTGQPDDMRTWFERATAACAPVRFASGMQFKVLEALAMEVPIVTTPVAADGLRIDGHEPPVILGEDEDELAAGVIHLLRHEDERRRLAADGRRFVEEHFVWARSTEKLERILLEAAGERAEAVLS